MCVFPVFRCVCVCVTEREDGEEREFGGCRLCPLYLKHISFCVCAGKRSAGMMYSFPPLSRGQISEEHYRWLIMNDRLIKLI